MRRIDKAFYPFFVLLSLGVIQEVVSFWLISRLPHIGNAPSVNIYGLLECSVIFWQFYCWNSLRSFGSPLKWFYALQAGSLVVWTVCNLVFFHLNDFDFPFYRILYPFVIVLLSINEINRMITHESRNLYKNARFVICLAFIIFFLYQVLYEGASLASGSDQTKGVNYKIISLFSYVNAFVNVVFVVAVLLIPRKRSSAFERIFDQIGDDN
ncbi:hypothetical protein [Dinghuibacter silviterrae]|uniref:hypothetical protein n=1 Tax=Dinghuibacter silviterrae TaxID=1539049 RepID=UPI00106349AB|nr:hypothetical protein [Dinghuibacter silviterrae]